MADETITITPAEMSAQIAAAVKAAIPGAVNDAIKATKNDGAKGTKAVQAQFEALVSTLKPKQLKKLMKRIGGDKPNSEKTPAEIAAEAAVAAAAAKTPTADDLKNKTPDFFKKRQTTEFEDRIKALEIENANSKQEAEDAKKMSALDRALSDLPWANIESRDMARDYYAPKLKRNDDGKLEIGGKPFDTHIKTEVPTKFENLLAIAGKGGSGSTRGSGKPGAVDIDALSDLNATPAQKAEAAVALAQMLGHQG